MRPLLAALCLALALSGAARPAALVAGTGREAVRLAEEAGEWDIAELDFLQGGTRPWGMVAADPFVYVVEPGNGTAEDDAGLAVIDATDPSRLRRAGFVAAEIAGASVTTVGGFVYGRDRSYEGLVFDVREPTRPRFVGPFGPVGGGTILTLASDGRHLFAAVARGQDSNLVVFDLARPELPLPLGEVRIPDGASGFPMAFQGGHAFVPTDAGVSTFDIRDPAAPRLQSTLALGTVTAILAAEDWLYVSVGGFVGVTCVGECWADARSLRVLAIDGGYPREVARLPMAGGITDFALLGPVLLALGEAGLDAFEVAEPSRPRLVAHEDPQHITLWIEAVGVHAVMGVLQGVSSVVATPRPNCPGAAEDRPATGPAIRATAFRVFLPTVSRGLDDCAEAELTRTTAQIGGSWNKAVVAGGHVYLGRGPRVVALAVEAGQPAREVGQSPILPGNVTALATAGSTLYAGDDAGTVSALEVSAPEAMRVVGEWRPRLWVRALVVSAAGDRLYVADASAVTVLDARDPARLEVLGRIEEANQVDFLALRGDLLVALRTMAGLRTFDVRDPRRVELLGEMDAFDGRGMALGDGLAYVANGSNRLAVVDLADPRAPAVTWTSPLGSSLAVALEGDRLYELQDKGAIAVHDLSVPRQPRLLSKVEIGSRGEAFVSTTGFVVRQGLAVVATDGSQDELLRVVDARLSGSPAEPGTLLGLGTARAIASSGRQSLVTGGQTVWQVGLADPEGPVVQGQWLLPGFVQAVALAGSAGAVAWRSSRQQGNEFINSNGVDFLALGDPPTHRPAVRLELAGDVRAITGSGTLFFVAVGTQVVLVDVADPAAPRLAGTIELPDVPSGLVVLGHLLYVQLGESGLARYDLSTPYRPLVGPILALPGRTAELAAAGRRLLVTLWTDLGLQLAVFDPDGPAWPAPVALLPIRQPGGWNLAADARRAYLTTDHDLLIFSLVDLAVPRPIATRRLAFQASDLLPLGDRLVVAAGSGGLRVQRVP